MPTHSGFSTGPGVVGREGERGEETRGGGRSEKEGEGTGNVGRDAAR